MLDTFLETLNSTLVILLRMPTVTTIIAPTIFKFHSGYITTLLTVKEWNSTLYL